MRLCRFGFDDMVLTGFYRDNRNPHRPGGRGLQSRQRASSCSSLDGRPARPASSRRRSYETARELDAWIDAARCADARDELTIPIDGRPAAGADRRPAQAPLAGGELRQACRRARGNRGRAPGDVSLRLHEAAEHDADSSRRPDHHPPRLSRSDRLGVRAGRRHRPPCRDVDEDEALSYVAGYTVVNDISDRGFKPNPGRKPRERDKFFDWMHGKWHDTFCPMGPCILSADAVPDPQELPIKLTVNGQIKQDANGRDGLPRGRRHLVPLPVRHAQPGDVIATGTPSGVGSATGTFLKAGDIVRATIAPIGTLENPVEAEM